MKCPLILLVCIMMVSSNSNASEEKLVDLGSLQWKYRVILIFAREPDLSKALNNLGEMEPGIDQRAIAWFALDGNSLHTNYDGKIGEGLREQIIDRHFTPLPSKNAVLLIGKDGTVKSRSPDLDLESTFGLIDQMPMRRAEMRRQNESSH